MSQVYKAIILAAGRGNRLSPRTDTVHKSLTRIQGSTILHRLLDQLARGGITQVAIVVGYQAESIQDAIGDKYSGMNIVYLLNKDFLSTNNIVSLQIAKHYLNEDILLFEGDIVIEDSILFELIKSHNKNIMVVDRFNKNMNGTVVHLDKNNKVLIMLLKNEQLPEFDLNSYFKTVNIYRFSKETAHKLGIEIDNYILNNGVNDYYEVAIRNIIKSELAIFYAILTNGRKWIEIDTENDLKDAYNLFGFYDSRKMIFKGRDS